MLSTMILLKILNDKLVTIPIHLKVEEMPKFARNRNSVKLPKLFNKMEENRSPHSIPMGYKKGFYNKLVNLEEDCN
uniref:Uncharacterized protein n=1 Tax=Romanomermis culicivorax TaxID=13658 RepID=A0A915JAE6_ROMCU